MTQVHANLLAILLLPVLLVVQARRSYPESERNKDQKHRGGSVTVLTGWPDSPAGPLGPAPPSSPGEP